MQALTHRVQYYETDRMGVTHHSNYIRFMEEARVEAFNGVVLTIGYDMTKQDGTRVFTGSSEHCFLNPEGHFIRLRRDQKEFYEMLMRELNVHHPAEGETSHE